MTVSITELLPGERVTLGDGTPLIVTGTTVQKEITEVPQCENPGAVPFVRVEETGEITIILTLRRTTE